MTRQKKTSLSKFNPLSKAFFNRSSDKSNAPSARGLKLETLENRELLSATTWESPAAAAVRDNSAIVLSVQSDMAPISLATLDASVEKIEATPAALGSNKANIEWTRVDGATKYYLMSSTSTDGETFGAWSGLKYVNDPGADSDAETVATQLTLTAGKYYKFKVRAVTDAGTTDFTETESAIKLGKPDSPTFGDIAAERSSMTATVVFNTVPGATSYSFEYRAEGSEKGWILDKTIYVGEGEDSATKMYIDSEAESVTLTRSMNPDKEYYFRITARNSYGASVATESEEAVIITSPSAPEEITAALTAPGAKQATISWTNVPVATKYLLQKSVSADGETYGDWTNSKYVTQPEGEGDVTTTLNLNVGEYTKFRVCAITPEGNTEYVETTDAVVAPKPEAPVITSATVDRSTGVASVEFDTVEGANLYRVDYTFNGGESWQFCKYVYVGEGDATSSKIYIDADATSATVEHKLNANKTYQFRVRATSNAGAGEYSELSDPVSFKGAAAPEWVKAEEKAGDHYAHITWAASEGAVEYLIEVTTNGGESWSALKTATTDELAYDEATDSYGYSYFISTGKTYQYRVRAYSEFGTDGSMTESNEVKLSLVGDVENFAVASGEAVNPTNYPIGERYSKVTITLTWDAADNATKYVIKYSKDGGAWRLLKNINDPTSTSTTFGAVAGSYYNFTIMATNSLGSSAEVKSGVYGVYKIALNRVDVVEGETLEATTVAPAGIATVYQWQYRTADGEWTDIDGATESTYTPTAEDVANLYWIRVLVSSTDEDAPAGFYAAEGVAGPVVDTLNAPSDFTFGEYDAETHALPMSWVDNSDNETGFYVEYSTNGGQT